MVRKDVRACLRGMQQVFQQMRLHGAYRLVLACDPAISSIFQKNMPAIFPTIFSFTRQYIPVKLAAMCLCRLNEA